MSISIPTDQVDEQNREKLVYGSLDYPIAFFDEHLPEVKVSWHWHDELELVLVKTGTICVRIGQIDFPVTEGEGYFANSGMLHICELKSRTEHQHAMVFHSRLIAGKQDILWKQYVKPILTHPNLPYLHLIPEIPWQNNILALAEEAWLAGAYDEEDAWITVKHNLCRILSLMLKHASETVPEHLLSSKSQREEYRIKKALAFIHANYSNQLIVLFLSEKK